MKHIWSKIKKVLIGLLVVVSLLLTYEWMSLYNDKDFRPDLSQTERLKESFAATLLYSIWGLLATIGSVFRGE